MNKTKTAIAINKIISLIEMITGITATVFFGMCAVFYITDPQFRVDVGVSFVFVTAAFIAVGVLLIIDSRKRKKLIKEFRDYVMVISNTPNGYIPNIAASLGVSEDIVKEKLEAMIEKKYFVNAFIDKRSNCIVLNNHHAPTQNSFAQNYNSFTDVAKEETVICKNCGGVNTVVKGKTIECDYCGSPIKS